MNMRKLFVVAACAVALNAPCAFADSSATAEEETSYFTWENAAYTTAAVVTAAIIINYLANKRVVDILKTAQNSQELYYCNHI